MLLNKILDCVPIYIQPMLTTNPLKRKTNSSSKHKFLFSIYGWGRNIQTLNIKHQTLCWIFFKTSIAIEMNIHTIYFLAGAVTITVWFSSRNHILAVTVTICMAPLPSLCSNILPEKPHKSVVNSYTWEKVPKREHIIKFSYIYSDIFIISQISLSSPPIIL